MVPDMRDGVDAPMRKKTLGVNGWGTVSHRLADVFSSLLEEEMEVGAKEGSPQPPVLASVDSSTTEGVAPISELSDTPSEAGTVSLQMASGMGAWNAVGSRLADVLSAALAEEVTSEGTSESFTSVVSTLGGHTDAVHRLSSGDLADDESITHCCSKRQRTRRSATTKRRPQREIKAWRAVGHRLADVLGSADCISDEDDQ